MTRQITPEIVARALEQESRGEARPPRSALRDIIAKLQASGVELAIRPHRRRIRT